MARGSRARNRVAVIRIGEQIALELAISRQAVAEWRDRQILSAAALLNQKAMDARAAFDREIETATAAETIFNASALANARIDALLAASLSESLPKFLDMAANELSSIDQRLAEVADALRRPDALVMPQAAAPLPTPPAAATEETAADTDQPGHVQTGKRGLLSVPARLAKRATSLAGDAGSAADELLQEKLGLKNRLRAAAAQRVAESWMTAAGEPKSPLAQLVSLIDETRYAARMTLS